MTPEEAVLGRILDLNTSAGTRVFMLKLPQKLATWPAARVQLISDPKEYHLRGGGSLGRAFVQVDSYAPESSGGDPYATVAQLADEINGDDAGSGLSGWIGSLGSPSLTITGLFQINRRSYYEPGGGAVATGGAELRLVRTEMAFRVFYKR